MDVQRDYRITVALSYFKKTFPCDENGEIFSEPSLFFYLIVLYYQ